MSFFCSVVYFQRRKIFITIDLATDRLLNVKSRDDAFLSMFFHLQCTVFNQFRLITTNYRLIFFGDHSWRCYSRLFNRKIEYFIKKLLLLPNQRGRGNIDASTLSRISSGTTWTLVQRNCLKIMDYLSENVEAIVTSKNLAFFNWGSRKSIVFIIFPSYHDTS